MYTMYRQQIQSAEPIVSSISFSSILCVVLEMRKTHEDLLQGDLADGIILHTVFLFGFFQSPKHLEGGPKSPR